MMSKPGSSPRHVKKRIARYVLAHGESAARREFARRCRTKTIEDAIREAEQFRGICRPFNSLR